MDDWECPDCDEVFATDTELMDHIEVTHDESQP